MGRYTSSKGGGDFPVMAVGTYVARCIQLIDIGTQKTKDIKTHEEKTAEQIIVRWEVPGERQTVNDKDVPAIVSRYYTNSLSEKANLRKDLIAWRGKAFTKEELDGFDLAKILGKPCMITIAHTNNGKAKVIAVTGLPKDVACKPQETPSQAFWLDSWDGNVNGPPFTLLPEGFRKNIIASAEYRKMMGGDAPEGQHAPDPERGVDPLDDDIPF